MVSPQNPLKPVQGMAPFAARMAMAAHMARHPRIVVTDLEARLGTTFTADTLAVLRRRYPKTRFVWMMGADNLGQIHRWRRWRSIFEGVPVAVFDRPTFSLRTLNSPAAGAYGRFRRRARAASTLPARRPPAWTFFPSRLEPLSSTHLRTIARQFGPGTLHADAPMPISKEMTVPMGSPTDPRPIDPREMDSRRIGSGASFVALDGGVLSAAPVDGTELAPEALSRAIVESIDADKGEDIVVIDLRTKSSIADYIVVASGRSGRQVGAMASNILHRLQPRLSRHIAVEGMGQGDWVLIDCGDVVVHLFRPEVRSFYAIEKMWGLRTPQGALPEAPSSEPESEPDSD
jgi:nicotinate-nucleotide adenylyltransferase